MLERALGIAADQAAVALELRATDLAGRWARTGRTTEAADLLYPIRARAGGCNPADLAAVDTLLAQAAS